MTFKTVLARLIATPFCFSLQISFRCDTLVRIPKGFFMPAPSFLAKDRHGGFLFRKAIPLALRDAFKGKKFIRKSLRTYHRPTALKLARIYATQADEIFEILLMKSKYQFDAMLLKARLSATKGKLSDLADKLSTKDLKALYANDASNLSPELIHLLNESETIEVEQTELRAKLSKAELYIRTASKLEKEILEREIEEIVRKDLGLPASGAAIATAQQKSPLISVLWDEYRNGKVKRREWKDESKVKEYDGQIRDLFEIIGGDRPASEFGRKDADKFIQGLWDFPLNRNKIYGKITDLKDIPETALTLSQSTISQRVVMLSSFFGHLATEEIIQSNPFKGKAIDRDSSNHPTPTITDIQDWFNLKDELIDMAWQFWIPRIALYMGARQNEIAQLTTKDILKDLESGIWYISINSNERKRAKTGAAKRKCPIHNTLLENGLLEYFDLVKRKGHDSLWPDLKAKGGDKGQTVSQYWTKLKNVHNVLRNTTDENGKRKTFHGLRRVIINRLMAIKEDLITIQAIVGHEPSLGSTKDYIDEPRTIFEMNAAVQKLVIDGVSWSHTKKLAISI